jgi:hypothetical protein
VAPILDFAVAALAVLVSFTLALLAWTLGIAIPRALRVLRHDLVEARWQVAVAERRLRERRTGDR